ncbi:SHS family lactate transporter-like MFS transporter [Pseudacidovorax intermedius]|uniref:SHS family lactate transporter-like MFS transporter n=1 Tax=Pseudacidovorax intermedius TaxID=433924 RepID=A0A370FAX7_9BURK|nr:MFS transporter [Pseudacidovorax intermedius]RDI19566.1 SHS family lactate transporter-like MFS transporter [Pseudacidovorax intermedius]
MTWTREQIHVTTASYLGWTLDAFDFFLMVFILKDIAAEFHAPLPSVALAITLTLAMRPVGALIFGRLADRFGRRPTMMANILCYAVLELLSGFSPSLATLIVLRALFGIAMGGEWGVGSALTMETVPARSRGFVSGLLQAGYPTGFLLASLVFGLFYSHIGWRGMFFVGILPALLVIYVRSHVPESPAWKQMASQPRPSRLAGLRQQWKLALYAVVLMTAFNFFSHGTQDLYPTFLRVQHGFDAHTVSLVTIVLNIGAIVGGLACGTLSERIGRRWTIFGAALFALPVLPLWAYSHSAAALAAGAFLMQLSVQGAWGVIPVHLNEISPPALRATFPGLVYQLGNLLASVNATMQASLATSRGNDYAFAMAVVAGTVAVVIAGLILFSREHRGVDMGVQAPLAPASGGGVHPALAHR